MKVGTDGVLLGAWAAVRPQDRRMLDIGTGTGLIALMLAQRAPEAHVTGVDIDDVGQARENAAASPWSGRVAFAQCPVQEFETPEPFDLIVSNPPFFVDSLTCPDGGRTAARHAVHLPFGDLRDAVLRLLAPGGRFAVILPTAEAERFLPSFIDNIDNLMAKHGVSDEHIVMRVTGCPNGCGRAMLAEVGLVGKAPGRYNLHLGGNRIGTRIPRMYKENITEPEILASLDELIGRWAKEREAGEGFGDFTVRAGIIRPVLDPARDLWD